MADQEPAPEVERPSAAQVRKSISEKGTVNFLDGRIYQSLKRHLTTQGYTPASYRETFVLGHSYPMVSPTYADGRSALARASGLGQGGRKPKRTAGPASRTKA